MAFRRLVITSEVESNPNYFFDDYQRVGDVYSTPRAATSHLDGWTQVAQLAEKAGVEIINCSPTSKCDEHFFQYGETFSPFPTIVTQGGHW